MNASFDNSSSRPQDILRVSPVVAQALGTEPLEDARHLLAPIPPLDTPPLAPAEGPNESAEYVVDLRAATPLTGDALKELFSATVRADLDFPRVYAEALAPNGQVRWMFLSNVPDVAKVSRLALGWTLADLLSEGKAAAQDLHDFTVSVAGLVAPVGVTVTAREETLVAAKRADAIRERRRKFGSVIEMRLMPAGRPFPARAVWRCLYALGLEWGDRNLFHWHDPATGVRCFTVSAASAPGYFLPERVGEGEGIAGVLLGFELPFAPNPLAIYDRMAVTLSFLRERLGGRPVTKTGAELDADRLFDDRDMLATVVDEMTRAGMPPGSPNAANFF